MSEWLNATSVGKFWKCCLMTASSFPIAIEVKVRVVVSVAISETIVWSLLAWRTLVKPTVDPVVEPCLATSASEMPALLASVVSRNMKISNNRMS